MKHARELAEVMQGEEKRGDTGQEGRISADRSCEPGQANALAFDETFADGCDVEIVKRERVERDCKPYAVSCLGPERSRSFHEEVLS